MNWTAPYINLVFGWCWILFGFLSGLLLGLGFHKDQWLGGYRSFKRRMYRLGHISFFGLGAVNFLFYFTCQSAGTMGPWVDWAGAVFVLGGVAMPLVCLAMAHWKQAWWFFGLPVLSLISGAVFTLIDLLS